ncbi:GntR family transcriptional regulator [Aeromicrobium fastidiosum]|uniref:GntR family transcriptional regulator n=1 Tax=Aeromicrobium TaxID=2040 RepID=UPI00177D941C|nr:MULTISPECIES: GntR family transcriptional regulator [Aeromicrobium]MBD8605494.1 GntR family transcriptional regulator [Aeromicrobium sp. CFBP 8757]MCL8250411.1 GntR family transcriptional regulator [Aeromicrobium fastidiosum]
MTEDSDIRRSDGTLYEDLRAKIVAGDLVPGTPLVEGALASEYQVSRSPVREALSRLSFEGLVERHERALRVRVLKPEDVLEIYEVRIALEAAAARAAAMRRTDLDLARLQRAIGAMQELSDDDAKQRAKLAHSMHFVIWAATHNKALIQTLESVQLLVQGLASTTLHYPDRWQAFLQESVDILEAVKVQDVERAGEVAALQMTNARDFRIRLYSSSVNGELPAFI